MRFIIILALIIFAVVSFHATILARGYQTCQNTHKESLAELLYNSQTLGRMSLDMCQQSYDTFVAWDTCNEANVAKIPQVILTKIHPIVIEYTNFLRTGPDEINQLKGEHDIRCGYDPFFMFNPPDTQTQ